MSLTVKFRNSKSSVFRMVTLLGHDHFLYTADDISFRLVARKGLTVEGPGWKIGSAVGDQLSP